MNRCEQAERLKQLEQEYAMKLAEKRALEAEKQAQEALRQKLLATLAAQGGNAAVVHDIHDMSEDDRRKAFELKIKHTPLQEVVSLIAQKEGVNIADDKDYKRWLMRQGLEVST